VDPNTGRGTEDDRVDEVRQEIERIRPRMAATIDALRYKADLPARIGDVLVAVAEGAAAQVAQRLASASTPPPDEDAGKGRTPPTPDENTEGPGPS
jgi:hypothetical protein